MNTARDRFEKLSIRALPFEEAFSLAEPLLERHWEEVALFKDLTVLKPDLQRYKDLEEKGRLFCIVAQIGGETIGYSANFLVSHLHYADLILCQNDVLYLVPERRQSRIGLSLINATISVAQGMGAKLMLWHAKYDTALDQLLERMDYEILDIVRAKRI